MPKNQDQRNDSQNYSGHLQTIHLFAEKQKFDGNGQYRGRHREYRNSARQPGAIAQRQQPRHIGNKI